MRKTVAAQQEGKDVVFAGWTTLDELEAAPSAAKLEGVIACLLDCNDGVRRERIQRRAEAGRWTVHTDEEVSAFLQAASEMRHSAPSSALRLDTSDLSIIQAADRVESWIA